MRDREGDREGNRGREREDVTSTEKPSRKNKANSLGIDHLSPLAPLTTAASIVVTMLDRKDEGFVSVDQVV